MQNIVYFDLETQHSFDEVGGRGNIRRLLMSVAVTYRSLQPLESIPTMDMLLHLQDRLGFRVPLVSSRRDRKAASVLLPGRERNAASARVWTPERPRVHHGAIWLATSGKSELVKAIY